MKDVVERADYYRIRAHRRARGHWLAAKKSQRMHNRLGIPVIVTTTVVGTAIFSTLSTEPNIGWKIATGLLALTAAVLAGLQTFFKYSELAEKASAGGRELQRS